MSRRQKGYTMVEMVIVISIIAILSAAALISLGVVNRAKAQAAANTLESQFSSLWVKTKSISQAKNQNVAVVLENNRIYPLCMLIEKDTVNAGPNSGGPYLIKLGYIDDANNFQEKEAGVTESVLPKAITLEYTPKAASGVADNTQKATVNGVDYNEKFLIQFNKEDGSVKYGAGTYVIKANGETIAEVVLDASTGRHYID